jgi:hypothetical protein
VAHVGQELALQPAGLLRLFEENDQAVVRLPKLLDHLVKGHRELAHLIAPLDGRGLTQVAASHAFGEADEGLERKEQAAQVQEVHQNHQRNRNQGAAHGGAHDPRQYGALLLGGNTNLHGAQHLGCLPLGLPLENTVVGRDGPRRFDNGIRAVPRVERADTVSFRRGRLQVRNVGQSEVRTARLSDHSRMIGHFHVHYVSVG